MNKSDRGVRILDQEQVQTIRTIHKPYDRRYGITALAKKYYVHRTTIERALGRQR